MNDIAVSVSGLSKEYRIGTAYRPTRLKEEIAAAFRRPFQRAVHEGERIWALRDVSFDVRRGEVVGICGRNGAGKSTLLKILSRVTEPTRGTARLRGRLSSLLEVGVGFHGELTGRENIFLNGALLGMKPREVQSVLEEIVEFSGIGKFLDTPVKHYSSGMHARLGFAVAAHLNQDILIIDEVLAVGDAAFQRKCFDKVHNIAGGGKTILLVSHNMFAVERFCSRAILLANGEIVDSGPPHGIISQYLADTTANIDDSAREGDEIVVNRASVQLQGGAGDSHGTIRIDMDTRCLATIPDFACGLGIFNSAGHALANATVPFPTLSPGPQRLTIEIVNPGLPPGDFFLGLAPMARGRWMKFFHRAADFRVPTTVTSDPFMLEMLDLSGISLKVSRVESAAMPDA